MRGPEASHPQTVTRVCSFGQSSGQACGTGQSPKAQFVVTPEEQSEPEGKGQESRRHGNRASAIDPCLKPDDREDRADGTRDQGDESGETGLTHADSHEEPIEAQAGCDCEADIENALRHMEVGRVDQPGDHAQGREKARGSSGDGERQHRESEDDALSRVDVSAVAPDEQKAEDERGSGAHHEDKTTKWNPNRVQGVVEGPRVPGTRRRQEDVPNVWEEESDDP